ncbi:multiple epidermal growth factor-like domains protein 11 [Gigantopelta aegis]|uniref:multiple epidermal growth factor-like domains protein 11 n=1 Tax=Gigantopelta aegis TaxID=1735272 RepID=UPI001B88C877|nr:multiple epidermal growth factor-like domains protein 11 [Gigantopelta aegis]
MSDCTGKMNKYNVVYACNYATGQTSDQKKKPYCTGTSCETCAHKKDNLCDCQGKVCFNGGTFDIQTCSCMCYPLYIGDQCETRICPSENQDFSNCGKKGKESWCSEMVNWGSEYCPFHCGLCPETCSITCENGGSVNSVPCTCLCPNGFSGERCENTDPPDAKVCDTVTCPKGSTLYEPNCYCAEDKYDCEGTDGEKQHPSCPMAWCDNSFWRLLCPHICGKCGDDCKKRKSNKAWFCHFSSCDNPNLKAMCPFKCKTC